MSVLKNRRRIVAAAAGFATATMLLAGCAGAAEPVPEASDNAAGTTDDWAAIEEAAREEGELIIYTAVVDSINEPLFAAFNEEYPEIEIIHSRMSSGELTTRFSSEHEAGAATADLIVIADTVMLSDQPEWFVDLDESAAPNVEGWNPEYRAEHFVHFMAGRFGVTYNTDLLPKPPTEWEDLVKPDLQGKGMLNEPGSGGSYMALYALLGETLGEDYLTELGESGQTWYDSSTTAIQQVAAGQYSFNAPSLEAHSGESRAAGAPVAFEPLSPAMALTHIAAINETASHSNAARVYLNWLLSPTGLSFACGGGQYNTLGGEDLPDCIQAPADLQIIDTAWGAKQAARVNSLMGTE